MDETESPPMFTVAEAAARLRLGESTLRRMIAGRQIGHVRLGPDRGRIFLREQDLAAYLASRVIVPGDPQEEAS